MLTETQWDQLDAIFARDGRHIRMIGSAAYILVDANHGRINQEIYETHEAAALALINGAYKPMAARVDSGVQHGAKNRPQWAKAKAEAPVQL